MYCERTKDKLWSLINGAETAQELRLVCENVLIPVLENTEGLWQEIGYCYKAAELACRAKDRTWEFMTPDLHAATEKWLRQLRIRLSQIESHYLQLQQVRFEELSNVELSV